MESTMLFAFLVLLNVAPVSTVVPSPLPSENGSTRLELIAQYFYAGFKYAEIVLLLLCRHNICLGLRQLKWILRSNNLRRRFVFWGHNSCQPTSTGATTVVSKRLLDHNSRQPTSIGARTVVSERLLGP